MSKVLVIFGSSSDEQVYSRILKGLKDAGVDAEIRISSAHRTPDELHEIIKGDYSLIIAGAGLSAALPGVIASKTLKPIIGVPCKGNYQGLDALLSIMQMPPGIPVLSVGVGQVDAAVKNAAKLKRARCSVNLVSESPNDALKKAEATFKEFDIITKRSGAVEDESINIEFVELDEPVPEKQQLVIYCPISSEDDSKAESALNILKHSTHGLWVGLNNGKNAALAAVEILNNGQFNSKLIEYRNRQKKSVIESDAKVKANAK